MNPKSNIETVVFGGGCFWCTEAIFLRLKGVINVTSGYAGGDIKDPNYYEVATGSTGHAEVIKIEFDPTVITFKQLLEVFFTIHDPTSLNKQGADTGTEYRSIILYTTDEQKRQIEEYIKKLNRLNEYSHPIVTEVKKLDQFYTAEEYHQKFYDKNPEQLYCQLVINPKLDKLISKFNNLVKTPSLP